VCCPNYRLRRLREPSLQRDFGKAVSSAARILSRNTTSTYAKLYQIPSLTYRLESVCFSSLGCLRQNVDYYYGLSKPVPLLHVPLCPIYFAHLRLMPHHGDFKVEFKRTMCTSCLFLVECVNFSLVCTEYVLDGYQLLLK